MSAIGDKNSREQVIEKRNALQLKDKEKESGKMKTFKELANTTYGIAKNIKKM